LIDTFRETARDLPKEKRRKFEAKITNQYLNGSARKAESYFGWSRDTVSLGQKELETGIVCLGNYSARGRKKSETVIQNLEDDIRSIVDRESQTDPKFQTDKKFCKISAVAVCKMLSEEKGYREGFIVPQTMNNILNRMGYSLKKT
jgi:transposase